MILSRSRSQVIVNKRETPSKKAITSFNYEKRFTSSQKRLKTVKKKFSGFFKTSCK
jgi:hypothetical protein